ncbi:cell division protein FtsE [Bifidobacterium margollesii]|uniref:Cell division ATP-binding protein FtsE n=1 Tax=Bifidobacterium margollesii TaxID=2020964 RepID=A0A2N5JAS2_9BIFI|nr:cell division ATP-binding protein FtsE [Bifidobacterium margollesii]PLS31302.1 cell division protein FtsE [Bifidobacterium margollesii]
MALIALDGITKIYPRGSRPALDDVSLSIDRGEFVFLVGASGSGKTTLLSLLLREEQATEGEIRVAGNDLRRLSNRQVPQYRRSIGFVFQDYKLLANKTVWQNVAFALEVIGTRRSTIRTLVPQVLQTVGLTGKEDRLPHELSGGEAQRVAIARAYVNHPQILLADEPTGNLDPTTSVGIMEVLEAINRTGTTIVMATHNEEIVNSMRKRVVELHNGRIVRDEQGGVYDSAVYFPDAEVEARAQLALGMEKVDVEQADARRPAVSNADDARGAAAAVAAAAQAVGGVTTGDPGIARLASSVHSGRTGRYGEAFAPVEDTLTWGKGISLEHASSSPADKSLAGKSPADDSRSDDSRSDGLRPDGSPAEGLKDDRESAESAEHETLTVDPDEKFKPHRSVDSGENSVSTGTADPVDHADSAESAESAESAVVPVPAPPAPPAPPTPPTPPTPPAPGATVKTDDTVKPDDDVKPDATVKSGDAVKSDATTDGKESQR